MGEAEFSVRLDVTEALKVIASLEDKLNREKAKLAPTLGGSADSSKTGRLWSSMSNRLRLE